ncbi:MAG TPA: heme lyase CcmF/NrfE family subunit [Ktedonobacterales bacterium]|nr:heme lyase CcmF/NrfE family subunit [Ktedonobacterales bacterium]
MRFTDLGAITLTLALVFALYALGASALGASLRRPALVTSGRRAVLVVAAFLLIASGSLIAAFLTHDFGAAYVAEHSSLAMPWYYSLSAFYGGQEGSLLYWATMLSIFSAIAVLLHRRAASLTPWVVVTLMTIESFFLGMLTFVTSPFTRTTIPPVDGAGLNPILQDPGMLIHPPMLLMGYMSWSVPFAFAVAAMITGRLDAGWLRSIRRWTLAAWTIQSTGLMLGMWWAYHVLGWGGYWGWDPVENAALLPWLTATAFLHSTMVQERRGTLKVWNLTLIIATFALSIFGTFEVRSGIISSVHSFAYSSVGPFFLIFLALVLAVSLGLFFYRLPQLKPESEFDSVISREGSFLINNLLLAGVAFATFWGTVFPIISADLRGQTMTVGTSFYQQVNGPLFIALIFMMGVGPLLAWRRASTPSLLRLFRWPAFAAAIAVIALPLLGVTGIWPDLALAVCVFTGVTILYDTWRGVRVRHSHGENYATALAMLFNRHRQRYGGYLVHLGLVVLAVGVIGSQFFQTQGEAQLKVGQTLTVSGYSLTYLGITDTTSNGVETIKTYFKVSQNGHVIEQEVASGERIFPGFENQPASIVAISTHQLKDLYVFLAGYDGSTSATIRVFVNPLVSLVWSGGLLMVIGGICCWWPERRRAVARLAPAKSAADGSPALAAAGKEATR